MVGRQSGELCVNFVHDRLVRCVGQIKIDRHTGFDVVVEAAKSEVRAAQHQARLYLPSHQEKFRVEEDRSGAGIYRVERPAEAMQAQKPLVRRDVISDTREHGHELGVGV